MILWKMFQSQDNDSYNLDQVYIFVNKNGLKMIV